MSQSSISAPVAPGPKDGLFFLTILMNMRNKPEVDWDLVAQDAGYNNAKTAATRFGQMKKKFSGQGATNGSQTANNQSPNVSFSSTTTVANSPTPSPSKRSPSKQKIKKEAGSGTNVTSGRIMKTPTKGNGLNRGQNANKVRAALDAENEEDEEDEVMDIFVEEGGMKWEDQVYVQPA